MRGHDVSLVLSQALYIVGVFIMTTLAVFADNAFRLQCKDFWVSGGDPNNNRLSFSWAFEFVSCIGTFISAAFIVWLVVLKARDDI